jgi:hypothetical protein
MKPFDGERNLDRKQLAGYLNRVGRGVNCRLDVPLLVTSDIRWAAKAFSDLAKRLTELGWEDERSDIYRILEARSAIEGTRALLARHNERETSLQLAEQARTNREIKRTR